MSIDGDSDGNRRVRHRMSRRLTAPLLVGLGALAVAFSVGGTSVAAQAVHPAGGAPDYAKSSNWLARPSSPRKQVDVFYLYPSAYLKAGPDAPNIAPIGDPGMRAKAKTDLAQQATAFDTVANIYAPYYRQADPIWVLTSPIAAQSKIIGGTPTTDATAAFAYYIKHDNHNRPFILAGHSQGSNVLLFLLSGYIEHHPAVYRRMVAAYVIGYGVTHKFLAANPKLKFAHNATDIGVIVSYNTEAPGLTIQNPVVQPGAIAINPITWTRTQRPAAAAQNRGSLMPDAAGDLEKVKAYADAQVDQRRGVVICSTCDVAKLAPGTPGGFPRGVLHDYDYMLYYFDIRHNAGVRIEHYLSSIKR
jgi:hypothetical protein